MMFRHGKQAFTLIELLIVVAIIGILAAIAIPNFLQAQVRSKVARVQSDVRTLATALEVYAVDNNDYMMDNWVYYTHTGIFHDLRRSLFRLTSPIEYITDVARDPFMGIYERPWDGGGDAPYIYEGSGKAYVEISTGMSVSIAHLRDGYNWILSSYGPSKTQIHSQGQGQIGAGTILAAGANSQIGRLVYDPTNGTVSFGMIIMTDKGWYNEQL